VNRFFEERVPERLVAADVAGTLLFDVTDRGRWLVDFGRRRVIPDSPVEGDCRLRLTAAELAEMIEDPFAGQVRAWQGSLRAEGDQALLRQMADALFPLAPAENSAYAGYYAAISRLIPDERFTFMNHGYAEEPEDFADLGPDERPWGYCINLVRRTLRGASVAGARVLDVGCGRGGAAAYIARHLEAKEVIGLDASADAIAFDERRHRHPRLRFVHGYATELPLPDASVDVVVCIESSHCYPDRAAFLAEVARTLRPGGSFCYADTYHSHALPATQRMLAEHPRLRVCDESDITAQVARAIDLNRGDLQTLLESAIDPELRNANIVDHLVRSVNGAIYRNYKSGRWAYHVWRMEART
jgi:ubiquinone/menaquinone biosynthesis C-methylase UbiE